MDLSERAAGGPRHPWELERAAFFITLLERHRVATRERILDVGSGDAWFAHQLRSRLPRQATITCWDQAYGDDELITLRGPGVEPVRAPPDGRFDAVLLLDVLEHIDDPVAFLDGEVRPRVATGTLVLACVPAFPSLFGVHDAALGHHRRYDPRRFVEQVEAVCAVVEHGPLFMSLVPARAASVLVERRRIGRVGPGDAIDTPAAELGLDTWRHGPVVTSLTRSVLRADATIGGWLGRRGVPVRGLSHWVIGRAR
jgi:hypothetical protein